MRSDQEYCDAFIITQRSDGLEQSQTHDKCDTQKSSRLLCSAASSHISVSNNASPVI